MYPAKKAHGDKCHGSCVLFPWAWGPGPGPAYDGVNSYSAQERTVARAI